MANKESKWVEKFRSLRLKKENKMKEIDEQYKKDLPKYRELLAPLQKELEILKEGLKEVVDEGISKRITTTFHEDEIHVFVLKFADREPTQIRVYCHLDTSTYLIEREPFSKAHTYNSVDEVMEYITDCIALWLHLDTKHF